MATTTPNYGWSVPTSSDYVAQGAVAIETLGDSVDSTLFTALGGAYPGLRLVKKQTIGTAVSSVAVTNAFSATYPNYKIVVSGGTGSANQNLLCRLGATATGYYWASTFYTYAGATSYDNASNSSSFNPATFNTNVVTLNMELLNPFASLPTIANSSNIDPTTTGRAGIMSGFLNNTTSYTDFTLLTSGGTITGGTIYVYGYGAS
jgi:hypothetical protein